MANEIPTVGGDINTWGTVLNNYLQKGQGWVNSEGFGTTGDGSDQTTEIAATIASITGSGIVFLPEGIYTVSSTITVPSGVVLAGSNTHYSGAQGTRIISTVDAAPCFQVGDGAALAHSAGFKNLRITASGTGIDGTGIYLYYVRWCVIDSVNITDFSTGTGIQIEGQATGNSDLASAQNAVSNIYSNNNLVHILLTGEDADNTSACDESTFTNIRIQPATLANSIGIRLRKGINNTFRNVVVADTATTAGTVGIDLVNGGATDDVLSTRQNSFYNTGIEKMATGIQIGTLPHDNTFYDSRILSDVAYTAISDSSGGGNRFIGTSGGENKEGETQYQQASNPQNLLVNGEMERWEQDATDAAPTGWVVGGDGGEQSDREGTTFRKGTYSAKLVSTIDDAHLRQSLATYTHLRGRWVTFSAWVYANYTPTSLDLVRLAIHDGSSFTNSIAHSGTAGWELLSVKAKIPAAGTAVTVYFRLNSITTTAYIDQACLVEGIDVPLPADSPLLDSKRLIASATLNPIDLADGAGETLSMTCIGAALGDFVLVSAPYDLQDLIVTGYVQSSDTVEIRVQNENNGANVNLASGTWKVMVFKV